MAYSTINKPSLHMNTVLYSGDGTSNRGITGTGFQPDLVVNKGRTFSSGAYNWYTFDSVRTLGYRLNWNTTAAEDDKSAEFISFDSDGFTVTNNAGSLNMNGSGVTYANFCWKADNTSGSSNTDGSITSTVAANTDAGFSIVKYTGTGANATVGHGLGATPKLIIVKKTDATSSWEVFHSSISNMNTSYIELNSTAAVASLSTVWGGTDPTSTTFHVGTDGSTNGSGSNYIAYCFSEVKGFSKFGSYLSNASTDGPFVYTGFKPAFIIVKKTSAIGNWFVLDNKRNTYNPVNTRLVADLSVADDTSSAYATDFLSNGFKLRTSSNPNDGSGSTFIYLAFAEQTLVGTNKVPCTAR